MPQQDRAPAFGCLDQHRQRIQTLRIARAAVFRQFAEPLPRGHEIACAPQHGRLRGVAVTACTARFLVIGFDRFGHAGMGDEPDVRLVDTHPERNRRNDYHVLARHEPRLIACPHLRVEACVIGQHIAARRRGELGRQFLHLAAGRGIDDAGPGMIGHQLGQLPDRIVAVANGITDVRTIEPCDDQPVLRDAQLGQDIGPRMLVRRRGQGQSRDIAETVHQGAQLAVIGPEIVPPFRDTMRLVDGEQGNRRRRQQVAKGRLARAFGCDIQQVELAPAIGIHRLAPVGIGAGQRRGPDAVGARGTKLVVHQRDKRRDDDARSLQHCRGQLVCQRFACTCRHHGKGRHSLQNPADDLLLPPAKFAEAEQFAQPLPRLGHAGIASCIRSGAGGAVGGKHCRHCRNPCHKGLRWQGAVRDFPPLPAAHCMVRKHADTFWSRGENL